MQRGLLFCLLFAGIVLASRAHADDPCAGCHGSVKDAADPKLVVDPEAWSRTVHGEAGIDCTTCHTGAAEFPHEDHEPLAACSDCHGDAVEGVAAGVHAEAEGAAPRPGCQSCHGPMHALRSASDEASPVHPKRLAATCGACHADPAFGAGDGVKRVRPIAAYATSVHARGIEAGEHAATCSSCHGSHEIRSAGDPKSSVARKNVPATCGTCHGDVARTFESSVHGQAAARGIREAPVCTDCHGEHRILGPADKGSPVFASNIPKMTCARCHDDLRVTEKFGLKSTSVTAFEDSFHGLAGRAGNASVANCASCHGVHDILPSIDPRSHVHPANLAGTCGACHPGAGATFAIGAVHVLPDDREHAHPAVYWVRLAYLWLIAVVIGGMGVHNALDLRRKAAMSHGVPWVPMAERRVRMAWWFRVVHLCVMLSFVTLVWSGFALTYQDAWWARPLLGWEERWSLRGGLHRVAALVLLAAIAMHLVHLAVDRRARAAIRAMIPTRHDAVELRERVRWLVGRRADMPRASTIGYVEKLEYLALAWGTAIMVVSGFLLWFESWSLAYLPKWLLDVALVVHFYEAVLATLAIVVWHLYSVIFDPLVYPMDTAWITGREVPGRTLERTASAVEPEPPVEG